MMAWPSLKGVYTQFETDPIPVIKTPYTLGCASASLKGYLPHPYSPTNKSIEYIGYSFEA